MQMEMFPTEPTMIDQDELFEMTVDPHAEGYAEGVAYYHSGALVGADAETITFFARKDAAADPKSRRAQGYAAGLIDAANGRA